MEDITYQLVNFQACLLHLRGDLLAHNLDSLCTGDVLVMLTLLGFGAGSPDWLFQLLALLQTSGHGHSMNGSGLLVLGPGGSGDVAANDGLKWDHRYSANLHAPTIEVLG